MTSRYDGGKEFVKWLKQWRAESVCMEQIQPGKREDDNESRRENGSISRREDIIPEPRMATKR